MSQDVGYAPRSNLDHRYDLSTTNITFRFREDQIINEVIARPHVDDVFEEIARLSVSKDWQDRVRAEALRSAASNRITLPDQFPCIYDANSTHAPNRVWVVSADVKMLQTLLPLYIELWEAYDAQWPEKAPEDRRSFAFGRLDGLSPRGMYLPGTTAVQVIGSTMLTHDGMYHHVPEHLRTMHPLHRQWEDSKQRMRASA